MAAPPRVILREPVTTCQGRPRLYSSFSLTALPRPCSDEARRALLVETESRARSFRWQFVHVRVARGRVIVVWTAEKPTTLEAARRQARHLLDGCLALHSWERLFSEASVDEAVPAVRPLDARLLIALDWHHGLARCESGREGSRDVDADDDEDRAARPLTLAAVADWWDEEEDDGDERAERLLEAVRAEMRRAAMAVRERRAVNVEELADAVRAAALDEDVSGVSLAELLFGQQASAALAALRDETGALDALAVAAPAAPALAAAARAASDEAAAVSLTAALDLVRLRALCEDEQPARPVYRDDDAFVLQSPAEGGEATCYRLAASRAGSAAVHGEALVEAARGEERQPADATDAGLVLLELHRRLVDARLLSRMVCPASLYHALVWAAQEAWDLELPPALRSADGDVRRACERDAGGNASCGHCQRRLEAAGFETETGEFCSRECAASAELRRPKCPRRGTDLCRRASFEEVVLPAPACVMPLAPPAGSAAEAIAACEAVLAHLRECAVAGVAPAFHGGPRTVQAGEAALAAALAASAPPPSAEQEPPRFLRHWRCRGCGYVFVPQSRRLPSFEGAMPLRA